MSLTFNECTDKIFGKVYFKHFLIWRLFQTKAWHNKNAIRLAHPIVVTWSLFKERHNKTHIFLQLENYVCK